VNLIGLQHLAWKFYFVYIAILIIECLCIWFLFVETKGPTLEEIARLFDGASANVSGKQVLDKKSELTGSAQVQHARNCDRKVDCTSVAENHVGRRHIEFIDVLQSHIWRSNDAFRDAASLKESFFFDGTNKKC
jgi:hypothetical protein